MIHAMLAMLIAFVAPASAMGQPGKADDNSASNLMVVLRESAGVNQREARLVPMGAVKGQLPNGGATEVDPGWYSYRGDMHVRFGFDTPTAMPNAGPEGLKRLGLTPEAALTLAVENIRRVYGAPQTSPWSGLMQVKGKSPDLASSYFLDHAFWSGLAQEHPASSAC